ncbi:hypothetical protein FA13DRAFT_1798977 [Coprinellus micaceus]|uniref:Uncharacterized protein n=1 Tax=Coprinellus micaceus TaxID=71717 RepID=A0A4Y7SKG6_COPMI|nr:hypothetical protein FA13DRAFT_1798977 [Coprinellus micaceus]
MEVIPGLPIDPSQEIFLRCLPDKSYPTLTPREAPLLLTQVSRAWRDLALRTPQLWSSIHVAVLTRWQHTDETVARILKCFECAKSAPMDVSLWSPPDCVVDPPLSHPVMTSIRSQSWHVRSLELNVSTGMLAHFYATTPPAVGGSSWPLLEKIVLNFGRGGMAGPLMRFEGASRVTFWSAPALKSISLTYVDVHVLNLPLPWGQMESIEVGASGPYGRRQTDLEYPSFTPAEAKTILKKCPMLSSLIMAVTNNHVVDDRDHDEEEVSESEPSPPTPGPFTHSHLKDLYLAETIVNPRRYPTTFLESLRLPALEKLTYILINPSDMALSHIFNHPLVLFFRTQATPSLIKKLGVGMETLSYRGLVECLKFMPVLGELRLLNGTFRAPESSVSCDDAFLETFLPANMRSVAVQAGRGVGPLLHIPDGGLCPRLDDIIIDEGSGFSSEGILHFARSRVSLSRANGSAYARPRRFYVKMKTRIKPDYAARDERGGNNEAEEGLWALGVDAIVTMSRTPGEPVWETTGYSWVFPGSRILRSMQTDRRSMKENGTAGYNPSAGLPRQHYGDEDEWFGRGFD